MTADTSRWAQPALSRPSPGQLAEIACLLEVTARKPGNVHRYADLPGLRFVDFLLSAMAIAEPLDRATETGVGGAVLAAVEATRRVVSTNTNLGIVLLLAPLAAVAESVDLVPGIERVLAATTVEDAGAVYRAIRLAQPGGLGEVADQDIFAHDPTITLAAVSGLGGGQAANSIVRGSTHNGFHDVLTEALPILRKSLQSGAALETAIVSCHLLVLARHLDSLIVRKYGLARAEEVSRRAAELIDKPGGPIARKRVGVSRRLIVGSDGRTTD